MKPKLELVEKERKLSDEDIAWQEVLHKALQVKTLDEVNEKALIRAGKQMRRTIFELLLAIKNYKQKKEAE